MEIKAPLLNLEKNFLGDNVLNKATNNKFNNHFNKNSINKNPIFANGNLVENLYDDNTPIKPNKEQNKITEIDETDIFIKDLLKEQENLIKLEIKINVEEEKNLKSNKEIEKSNSRLNNN